MLFITAALGGPGRLIDGDWSDDSDFESPSAPSRATEKIKNRGATIKIGTKFSSFEHLEKSIRDYQKEINCCFYIRDSVTRDRAPKKNIKKVIAKQLRYYSLTYCCIHGGKKFVSKATGVRSSS